MHGAGRVNKKAVAKKSLSFAFHFELIVKLQKHVVFTIAHIYAFARVSSLTEISVFADS